MWKQPSVHSLHKVFHCCGSWGSCYSFMNADGFYRTTSAYCLLHNVTMEMFSRKDSLIKCPFIAALLNLRLSLSPRHPPTRSYIESLMWNHRTWKVGGIPVPPAVSRILLPPPPLPYNPLYSTGSRNTCSTVYVTYVAGCNRLCCTTAHGTELFEM